MQKEIILTPHETKIKVCDIPKLFATALHPDVKEDTPCQIMQIKKMPLTEEYTLQCCGEGSHAFQVPLEASDIESLWGGLPPFVLPMEEAQWEPYNKSYVNSNITDWQLIVIKEDPNLNQSIAWHATVEEYKKEVMNAVLTGDLIPRSQLTFIPLSNAVGDQLQNAFVDLDNLKEYAIKFGIGLRVSEISSITSKMDNSSFKAEGARGVSKKVIQRVFEGKHFNSKQWERSLGDVPKWLEPCRVSRGSKGKRVSHTWNPVLIGIALMDKGVTKKELNLVFMNLKDWKDEWQEKTDLL